MSNKHTFIREIYTDQYKSLYQSFILSENENDESNGFGLIYHRKMINPNLTWHHSTEYLDENFNVIKREYFDKDGKLIKTIYIKED